MRSINHSIVRPSIVTTLAALLLCGLVGPVFAADQIPMVKEVADAFWQSVWSVAGIVFAIIFLLTLVGVAIRKLSWTAPVWVLGCTIVAGAVTRLIQWGMSFGGSGF
jgi:hypothetical protein